MMPIVKSAKLHPSPMAAAMMTGNTAEPERAHKGPGAIAAVSTPHKIAPGMPMKARAMPINSPVRPLIRICVVKQIAQTVPGIVQRRSCPVDIAGARQADEPVRRSSRLNRMSTTMSRTMPNCIKRW